MRQSLILVFLFSSEAVFSQYRVDSTVKKEYLKLFEKFPKEFKDVIATEYEGGFGLLYEAKTDTLNKKDLRPDLNSVKIHNLDPITGEVDTTKTNSTEQEQISKNEPFPLSCNCSFKNDTLTITSGIYLFSGFAIITKVYQDKVKGLYFEGESESKVLQRALTEEKANEITIPATINFFTLDRKPTKNIKELFGQVSITTNGYYSYINVWSFKSDYIFKRMKYELYFRCDMKRGVQH
jgi:hypothetical protein